MTTTCRLHFPTLLWIMFAILTPALNGFGQTAAPGVGDGVAERQNGSRLSGGSGQGSTSMPANGNDRQFAQCLIIDNEGEITLSEIGRQRAQHPAVKEFAERMVKEHTEMIAKLRPSAGPDYSSRPNATHPDSNRAPQRTTNPDETLARTGLPDAASANAGGISGGGRALSPSELTGGLDFTALKQELAT